MLERQQKVRQKGEGFPAFGTEESPDTARFVSNDRICLTFAGAVSMDFPAAVEAFGEFILCRFDRVW